MLTFRAPRAAVAAMLVFVAARLLVPVRRLRRSAGRHAHDLERTATVGVGGDGAGEAGAVPVRLVVLGDSAARGYGLQVATEAFPQLLAGHVGRALGRSVAVTSLATDGHRTVDVAAMQAEDPVVLDADVVVVSVGVNDAIRLTRRRALASATRHLLDAVTAAAPVGAAVVLVPCPDLSAAPGFPPPLGWLVGWRCRRVERAQVRVAADAGVPTVRLPRPDATMFGDDGFHPGVSGHVAMAEVVARGIVAHLPRPA